MMNKQNNKRTRRLRRGIILFFAVIVALCIAAGATAVILYQKGKVSLKSSIAETPVTLPEEMTDEVETEQDGRTVYYNNEQYLYNEDVVSILIIGVDKSDFEDVERIGSNGQADANYLVVLNPEKSAVDVIPVNRDTMTDVDVYSYGGQFLETKRMQLCLAYAYGDGKESSCENVEKSVSRILYGIPVKNYIAVDFDAIPILVDAVGGVTVSEYTKDGSEKTGNTVTLYGKEAVRYVRYRDLYYVDSNRSRIERQKEFISALAKKIIEKTKEDFSTPISLYRALAEYMVTNVDISQVTYIVGAYYDKIGSLNICDVPGEIRKNEYVEFTPDAKALYQLILNLFYKKK